jgi:hypothetical protein
MGKLEIAVFELPLLIPRRRGTFCSGAVDARIRQQLTSKAWQA